MTLKIAVLGSGQGTNFQAIVNAIDKDQLNATIVCVIADVRDALILDRARKHKIPAYYVSAQPFKTKLEGEAELEYIRIIKENKADVIALAGFMRILKNTMLREFGGRIINVHPSLLPAFPGLASWKQALEGGAKETGCTVHFVDQGVDTGPIILQRKVQILPDDTAESLHARIQIEEHLAFPQALRMLTEGQVHARGINLAKAN